MWVLVLEQTEGVCAHPRHKGKNVHLKGGKSLFYVLVSFMPLTVIILKSVCLYVCMFIYMCKYFADNKRHKRGFHS